MINDECLAMNDDFQYNPDLGTHPSALGEAA
jgi:hypothetical protein